MLMDLWHTSEKGDSAALLCMQEALAKAAEGRRRQVGRLNHTTRKNRNHPGLITGAFNPLTTFTGAPELLAQCGKMQLLDRLLKALKKGGHKLVIFSQVCMHTSCHPIALPQLLIALLVPVSLLTS